MITILLAIYGTSAFLCLCFALGEHLMGDHKGLGTAILASSSIVPGINTIVATIMVLFGLFPFLSGTKFEEKLINGKFFDIILILACSPILIFQWIDGKIRKN